MELLVLSEESQQKLAAAGFSLHADINQSQVLSSHAYLPLHYAASIGDDALVRDLLFYGANDGLTSVVAAIPQIVIVESPYSGNIAENIKYARRCMMDSCNRGEAPFLSHLLYTQTLEHTWANEAQGLNDAKHWITREQGILNNSAFRRVAHKTVLYVDLGITVGMQQAETEAKQLRIDSH